MVDPNILKGLIQTSTILSMIGAALVAFTWAYPLENRIKHGRILLLWLSVTDFLGSLFYFLQTFDYVEDSGFCKAFASLDIFFPVASFIWTDFIAYYLFLVVRKRSAAYRYNWKRLLFSFHVVAWSTSFATMMLVILFNHAGRDSEQSGNDDDGGAETAGWCWIKANNAEERWIWELIGGKFIEWTSGLIIVPYLYISVAYQLYQIDRPQQDVPIEQNNVGNRIFGSKGGRNLQAPLLHPSQFPNAPSECNTEFNGTVYSDNHELTGVPADMRVVNVQKTASNEEEQYSQQSDQVLDDAQSEQQARDLSYSRTSSQYGAYIDEEDMEFSYSENMEHPDKTDARLPSAPTQANAQSRAYFSRFYLKLFVLPIVFILIRLWSSLRVILLAAGATDASRNEFLQIMQAVFDPSQGFFNAVLFVFFSPEDRSRLWETITRVTRQAFVTCLGKDRVEYIVSKMPRLHFPSALSSASLAALEANGVDSEQSIGSNRSSSSHYGGYRSKMPSQDAIVMRTQTPKLVQQSPGTTPTAQNQNSSAATNHPLGDRRLTTSSDVIDIEDDFECSDGDRLSDYSFDGRVGSNDATSGVLDTQQGLNMSPIQANQLLPPHIQALQQFHQLQTLQAYSANRSASRSLSHSMASSASPAPMSTIGFGIGSQSSTPALSDTTAVTSATGNTTVNNPLHAADSTDE